MMLSRVAKPSSFTKYLTPDSKVPSIQQSENAPNELIYEARIVDGSFTWVAPEKRNIYELKWISATAADDLKLKLDPNDPELAAILGGQKVIKNAEEGLYPFAQNYAGDQFGSWAGQLGDGRAITSFRVGDYEIQLKGAGMTPYSRFADGKAVVRSSIREALVSEYMNKLGIPTQRCLSLVNLPATLARRERVEHCAVIARMAPTWIRIGTFQLHDATGNRSELRKLADFCIDQSKLGKVLGSKKDGGNKYFDMFRDVSLRNAKMMAQCQAYGFLNGVSNTDNVSIVGLSLDYGPFAFMDKFNAQHTPNHDDYMRRYGFRNAPVIMWWNCVKLGECSGELIGIGENYDDPDFRTKGISDDQKKEAGKLATDLIMDVGREFQQTYESEYQRIMSSRLGLTPNGNDESDLELIDLSSETMQECELDYNSFFRKSAVTQEPDSFMPYARTRTGFISDEDVKERITNLLQAYRERLNVDVTADRTEHMKRVNPNFILRNSVLANVIDLAELGNWDAFDTAAAMSLDPFADSWPELDEMYKERYMNAKISAHELDNQLSCSS